MDRKIRSEERLRQQGVPVDETLPVIEREGDVHLRNAEETAARSVILYALQGVIFHDDPARVVRWVEKEGLWAQISPEEKPIFQLPVSSLDPAEKERQLNELESHPLTWRMEALWALLWALGKAEKLGFPAEECDAPLVKECLPGLDEPVRPYLEEARLRPVSEILDELDWLRRLLWAGEQRKEGEPVPGGYEPAVAWQWHEALNWLINDQDWR
ncbi:DUF4272 domain-containing protein [Salinithrix halophila]